MSKIMNKIALLKGGLNSENEVSLKTAEACFFALKELKYEIVEIDIKDQFISKIIDLSLYTHLTLPTSPKV